jgi:hypothetical protein
MIDVESIGVWLIESGREEAEHLYAQSLKRGHPRDVILMLDLAEENAQAIARDWRGDRAIDRALAQSHPEEGQWRTVCICCMPHEIAGNYLARLSPEARDLIADDLPPNRFHVIALSLDGITQTDLALP